MFRAPRRPLQRRPTYNVPRFVERAPLDLRIPGPLRCKILCPGRKIDVAGAPGRVFDLKCAACGCGRRCTPGLVLIGVLFVKLGGVQTGSSSRLLMRFFVAHSLFGLVRGGSRGLPGWPRKSPKPRRMASGGLRGAPGAPWARVNKLKNLYGKGVDAETVQVGPGSILAQAFSV